MILKSATQDFDALIKRINVQKDFENADENNKYVRPRSLLAVFLCIVACSQIRLSTVIACCLHIAVFFFAWPNLFCCGGIFSKNITFISFL